MRIIVSICSVIYTGRGDVKMNPATRAIFLKSDGAISIHNDISNKALNYMSGGSVFSEEIKDNGNKIWTFENNKERLTIYLHDIISDTQHELDAGTELPLRNGTEKQLQEWLAENPHAINPNYTFVSRECDTGEGRVDLIMKDEEGEYLAVEVKRVAMMPDIGQITKYRKSLAKQEGYENVRGVIAALEIRPNAQIIAEKRNIEAITINPALWATRKQEFRTSKASENTALDERPFEDIILKFKPNESISIEDN